MKTAVYPGSFDPTTLGHMDIIQRAAGLFEHIIVAVSVNQGKQPLFSMEERVEMLRQECRQLSNVEVCSFDGLLSDFIDQRQAQTIVRGLRAISDFEYEFQMALMNHKLNSRAETVFLVAQPTYSYLSSSIVKEIASLGGDIGDFVSAEIAKRIRAKFNLEGTNGGK
jgi:pantetheine-phosphate adenylyltransferase